MRHTVSLEAEHVDKDFVAHGARVGFVNVAVIYEVPIVGEGFAAYLADEEFLVDRTFCRHCVLYSSMTMTSTRIVLSCCDEH